MADQPERIDIKHQSEVWVKPGQSARLTYPFKGDLDPSTYDFTLTAQQRRWSFGGNPPSEKKSDQWNPGDAIFSIDGTDLLVDLPQSKIQEWDRRTMELILYAENQSNEDWEVQDFLLTVSQGS